MKKWQRLVVAETGDVTRCFRKGMERNFRHDPNEFRTKVHIKTAVG